ncbi:endonuclease/exonuclease/phosphatase family protein [Colwelliaceae bacterium 6471]
MMNTAQAKTTDSIRIATFNVSMEALNYMPYDKERKTVAKGNELASALANNHQQIKNIAEIIQRVNPDIILLNEFDRADDSHQSLKHFIEQYLAVSQNGQPAINFPYFYQGPVNTGVKAPFDMNNNGILDEVPADTYGFGHFPGHFGMALLSKYPIDIDNVRTFQLFKWRDMPDALQPIDPQTNSPWYDEKAWDNMRLSSKSHWDLPINVNNHRIHILASHPTPPVFDGPEDRNGKRNHDEIRFWHDYISKEHSTYIYDDNKHYGGLAENVPFVIVGDQNASAVDGDAIKEGIVNLLTSDKLQDPLPNSAGGKAHQPDNPNAINHTAYWGMRADYVLPSTYGWHVKDSGVFWPGESDESYRLIKDRTASSDHRLVWVDLDLTNTDN